MQIVCPHCGFTKEIDGSKLPPGAKTATCPKCREKFELNPDQPSAPAAPPTPPPLSTDESSAPPKFQPTETYVVPSPAPETPAYQAPSAGAATPPPPLPGQPSYAQQVPKEDIPWETRRGGFFGDLFATIKMVLFKPGVFFSSMPVDGGTGRPLVFAIVNGVIGFFFVLVWQALFMLVGVGLSGEMSGEMGAVLGGGALGMIVFLVISPIFITLGLFIGAAIEHLFLLIVRGGGSGYQATFRVMSYVSPTYLCNIIPFAGGFIGGIWALILLILGLSKAHRTGIGRVIVAVIVIPIVLVVLLGIVAAIAIPLIAGMR